MLVNTIQNGNIYSLLFICFLQKLVIIIINNDVSFEVIYRFDFRYRGVVYSDARKPIRNFYNNIYFRYQIKTMTHTTSFPSWTMIILYIMMFIKQHEPVVVIRKVFFILF